MSEAIESTHALRVRVDAWKRGLPTEVLAAQLGRSPPVGLSEDNVIDAIALARWLAAWPKMFWVWQPRGDYALRSATRRTTGRSKW